MEKIRIGNDIRIRWNVMKNGRAADLEGKAIRLFMSHARGREEVRVFLTEGSVVSWTFEGMNQNVLGRYTFTIDVRHSSGSRYLIQDKCNVFELVRTTESEDADQDYNIEL